MRPRLQAGLLRQRRGLQRRALCHELRPGRALLLGSARPQLRAQPLPGVSRLPQAGRHPRALLRPHHRAHRGVPRSLVGDAGRPGPGRGGGTHDSGPFDDRPGLAGRALLGVPERAAPSAPLAPHPGRVRGDAARKRRGVVRHLAIHLDPLRVPGPSERRELPGHARPQAGPAGLERHGRDFRPRPRQRHRRLRLGRSTGPGLQLERRVVLPGSHRLQLAARPGQRRARGLRQLRVGQLQRRHRQPDHGRHPGRPGLRRRADHLLRAPLHHPGQPGHPGERRHRHRGLHARLQAHHGRERPGQDPRARGRARIVRLGVAERLQHRGRRPRGIRGRPRRLRRSGERGDERPAHLPRRACRRGRLPARVRAQPRVCRVQPGGGKSRRRGACGRIRHRGERRLLLHARMPHRHHLVRRACRRLRQHLQPAAALRHRTHPAPAALGV